MKLFKKDLTFNENQLTEEEVIYWDLMNKLLSPVDIFHYIIDNSKNGATPLLPLQRTGTQDLIYVAQLLQKHGYEVVDFDIIYHDSYKMNNTEVIEFVRSTLLNYFKLFYNGKVDHLMQAFTNVSIRGIAFKNTDGVITKTDTWYPVSKK